MCSKQVKHLFTGLSCLWQNHTTVLNTLRLTQQREGNSKDEYHDTTTQRQHKVAGDHNPDDEQGGVLPLKVLDGGFVFSCPHRAHEDHTHNSSTQKHAKRVQESKYENMTGEIFIGCTVWV